MSCFKNVLSNTFYIALNGLCQSLLIARKSNLIKIKNEGGDEDGTRKADKEIKIIL